MSDEQMSEFPALVLTDQKKFPHSTLPYRNGCMEYTNNADILFSIFSTTKNKLIQFCKVV